MSAFSLDKAGPRTATCGSPFPVSCRLVTRGLTVSHRWRTRRVFASSAGTVATPAPPISVTDRALLHLQKLQSERKDDSLLLRIGVRSGGCSGMSYQMDFEAESNVMDEDSVIEIDSGRLKMVCDPKSLLYLFGMSLDYSDALIGGGFQFHNPNATDTCGCGKSFGV